MAIPEGWFVRMTGEQWEQFEATATDEEWKKLEDILFQNGVNMGPLSGWVVDGDDQASS
jgi:hypothetical protein